MRFLRSLIRGPRLPTPKRALKKAVRKAFAPSPKALGDKGERKVNSKLGWRLDSSEYYRFADLHLPSGNGSTQIDHVVVSRYGVFVVETKNYSGWIFGDEKSKVWTQTLYGEKHKFQNPLRQNYKHTKAVESFLSLHSSAVFSVVVFAGSGEFRTKMPSNVMHSNKLVRYIRSKSDLMFNLDKVEWMVDRIQRHQSGRTIQNGDTGRPALADPEPSCPTCGAGMVNRTARTGKNAGRGFLGCSNYPRCRGTRSIPNLKG